MSNERSARRGLGLGPPLEIVKHQRTLGLHLLAGTGLAVGLIGALGLDDPRLRFTGFLAWWSLATAGALLAWRLAPGGRALRTFVLLALVLRGIAWMKAPAFSEDVFRYVYEGRVALWGGPLFVFQHPPADAPLVGVPDHLMGAAWLRINHPELATIYPPLAMAVFSAAAAIGSFFSAELLTLKALLVVADLFVWRMLHLRNPRAALLWGLSPLVIWEVAREGHADVLSSVGLAMGAVAFSAGQPLRGYFGWVSAALAKLNGLVLTPLALRFTRSGAWLLIPGFLLLSLPYVMTAGSTQSGITAYASRWRAGDGAFSLILLLAEWLIGGDWTQLSLLGHGATLTRHHLARGLVAVVFGVAYLLVLGSRPTGKPSEKPVSTWIWQKAGLLLVLLLLLSPTLHPWYVLWALPFAALGPFPGRGAVLWLAGTVAVLHHPGWLELLDGHWRDLPSVRAFVHGPAWALLAWEHRATVVSKLSWPDRASRRGIADRL